MIPEGLESRPVGEHLSSLLRILGSTPNAKQKVPVKTNQQTWKPLGN